MDNINIGSTLMRFSRLAGGVVLGISLALPVAAAWAQTVITEQPARETAVTEKALRAAERARDLMATDEFEPTTYAEVLKDPDNIELSFRFARTQVRNSDLHGAASTLERILLVDPNLTPVRLFYAVVLFRLEDLDESQREFQTVAALEIPPDVRAEVEAYLTRIDYLRRKTRYTASLSLGGHYDTNRNARPSSGTVLFIDTPIELIGDDEDDFGYLGIASFRIDHDLGYQERHELFGALTYYQDEQIQQDTFDLQSFTLEAGGVYREGPWGISVTPTFFATNLQLSRETYYRDQGLDLRFARDFGRRLTTFAGVRLSYQNFDGIRESLSAAFRDGRQIEGLIGASYAISPTMRVTGDYLRSDKNAKADFFAYERDQFRLSHVWLLGDEQFLLTNATYQRDRYDVADGFVSASTRHDDIVRVRLTYGAPLGFLVGEGRLWAPLEDIVFSGSAEYLRSNSNIPNFDYDNWRGQVLMTKTWRF